MNLSGFMKEWLWDDVPNIGSLLTTLGYTGIMGATQGADTTTVLAFMTAIIAIDLMIYTLFSKNNSGDES